MKEWITPIPRKSKVIRSRGVGLDGLTFLLQLKNSILTYKLGVSIFTVKILNEKLIIVDPSIHDVLMEFY